MKPWMLVFTVFFYAGCASTPNYTLNVPLSEVAAAAASETLDDNKVSDRPIISQISSNLSSSLTVDVDIYDGLPWIAPEISLSDWRVTLFSHRPISQRINGYQLDNGYQLSGAARDGEAQFRFSAAFAPGLFAAPHNDGLKNLYQFDISADASYIVDLEPVHFEVGGRIGLGALAFSFNQPIQLGFQSFTSDSISVLYFGLPFGMGTQVGPIVFEALITPTFNILSEKTDIGFDNDIARTHWSWPLTLGVGIQF